MKSSKIQLNIIRFERIIFLLFFSSLPIIYYLKLINAFFTPKFTLFAYLIFSIGTLVIITKYIRKTKYKILIIDILFLIVSGFIIIINFTHINSYRSIMCYFNSLWYVYIFLFILRQFQSSINDLFTRFNWLLTLFLAFPIILGFGQVYNLWDIDWKYMRPGYKLVSTFGNPNAVGQYIIATLPLVFFLIYINKKMIIRCINLVLLLLFLITLYNTNSTGSYITAIFELVVIIILFVTKKTGIEYKKIFLGFVCSALIIVAVFLYLIANFLTFDKQGQTFQERLAINNNTISMINENIITGVGTGNFQVYYKKYRDYFEWSLSGINSLVEKAHNEYLQIFSETGIIGFSVFILLFIYLTKNSLKFIYIDNKISFIFPIAGISGILLNATVTFNLHNPVVLCLIFIYIKILLQNNKYIVSNNFFISLIIFIIISLGIYFNTVKFQSEINHTNAKYYHKQIKNNKRAIELYVENIKKYPYYLDNYGRLTELLIEMKNYKSVMQIYPAFKKIDPYNHKIYKNSGYYFYQKKKYNKAISFLRTAILLNPYNFNTYGHLGNLYYETANDFYAFYYFHQVILIKPNTIEAINNIGNIYNRKKNYQKAIYYYQKVLDINPNIFETLFNIGYAYFRIKDIDNSLKYMLKARKINPNNKYVDRLIKKINNYRKTVKK